MRVENDRIRLQPEQQMPKGDNKFATKIHQISGWWWWQWASCFPI